MSAPVLIVGAGLAGLFTALRLAPRPVILVSPGPLGEGAASAWAQGGIAAAVGADDRPDLHAEDTIAAGAGLVVDEAARLLCAEAPARIADLVALGVPFTRSGDGRLKPSREAAHSRARVLAVDGDRSGFAVMQALAAAIRRTPSVTIIEGQLLDDLIITGGRVRGAIVRACDGGPGLAITAPATVLATGGIGGLFAVTTNPPGAIGAGLAIAARHGAVIADPEFVQFHPTALAIGRDPAPLATEALRGEGAVLVTRDGRRLMQGVHPALDLAPRDVVARAVQAAILAGEGAFLDGRAAPGPGFATHFPTVHAAAAAAGLDPARDLLPVAPAAHFHMGGIATDLSGRTSLPGLWAVGEVAATGVHGANRLASNSLLEAVVFGARAAEAIGHALHDTGPADGAIPTLPPGPPAASDPVAIAALRRTMQERVGVVRDGEGLAAALAEIGPMRTGADPVLAAMADCAFLIAAAALLREESRGGHYRADRPLAGPARRTLTTMTALEDALLPRQRRAG
ncbi:L-aspartate oxidase [Chelatococcus sp. GW1]|uniref:L-aspartate oxidase n=1 Tax=Chelatococcus sp. GW1 TaxID=1211115 RepID=UPI0002D5EC79|nr:L-aspartate oxidase [Chelatococcus sp. GW1]